MSGELSRTLNQITTRMEQAADRILRESEGVTYRRYQVLYAMDRLQVTTQRDLARWMGLHPALHEDSLYLGRPAARTASRPPAGYNQRPHTLPELRCFPVPT